MNAILTILIGSIFVNNFAMSRFYGICPFLGVSKKLETAFGMGMAVTFVMAVASLVAYLVNAFLLIPLGLEYLQTIAFILVIAVLVQIVEMAIKKMCSGPVSGAWRLSAADYDQLCCAGRCAVERD